MKIYSKEQYLLAANKVNVVRMPNGIAGKMVQYRTKDVDGKIFWHFPQLAEVINWTNRILDDSGQMFTQQWLGRVYDYVVVDN